MKDTQSGTAVQRKDRTTEAVEGASANMAASENVDDGIDRRNFLSCMAWAGTGLLWTMAGASPPRSSLPQPPARALNPRPTLKPVSASCRSVTVTSASIKRPIRMSPGP
jgi:hypothetical protein